MSLFDFSSLFATYSISFTRIPKVEGYRDYTKGGQWVKSAPATPIEMTGIVVPLTNEDLRFDTAGTYTRQDQKVYVRKPSFLLKNDEVIVEGVKYRVVEKKEYPSEYTDFNVYVIRRTDIEKGNDG